MVTFKKHFLLLTELRLDSNVVANDDALSRPKKKIAMISENSTAEKTHALIVRKLNDKRREARRPEEIAVRTL